MKAKTVTARIDEQMDFQIEYLKRHLKVQSTTQILTEAISTLYSSVKQKEIQKSPFDLLEEFQMIGCLEGEEDLSQTYKEKLFTSLQKKHRPTKSKRKKTQ